MTDREYFGFIWDEKKADDNIKKHKISFEVAARIFNDPCLYSEFDSENSTENETRFTNIGLHNGIVLLTVSSTDRNGKTRIISARKSTKKERRMYENNTKTLRGY